MHYYFEKQIEQPMVRLIAPLVGENACKNFFKRAINKTQNYINADGETRQSPAHLAPTRAARSRASRLQHRLYEQQ